MNYSRYSRSYDRWKNIDFAKNCAMNKNRYERTGRDKEHGEDRFRNGSTMKLVYHCRFYALI